MKDLIPGWRQDSFALGCSLANLILADLPELMALSNKWFDEWVWARINDATNDYLRLREGRLSLGVARKRWAKHLKFARDYHTRMEVGKGQQFADELLRLIEAIYLDIAEMEYFDQYWPWCEVCETDMVLCGASHECVPTIKVVFIHL